MTSPVLRRFSDIPPRGQLPVQLAKTEVSSAQKRAVASPNQPHNLPNPEGEADSKRKKSHNKLSRIATPRQLSPSSFSPDPPFLSHYRRGTNCPKENRGENRGRKTGKTGDVTRLVCAAIVPTMRVGIQAISVEPGALRAARRGRGAGRSPRSMVPPRSVEAKTALRPRFWSPVLLRPLAPQFT